MFPRKHITTGLLILLSAVAMSRSGVASIVLPTTPVCLSPTSAHTTANSDLPWPRGDQSNGQEEPWHEQKLTEVVVNRLVSGESPTGAGGAGGVDSGSGAGFGQHLLPSRRSPLTQDGLSTWLRLGELLRIPISPVTDLLRPPQPVVANVG